MHGDSLIVDTETGALLTRHNDLWFDDGSIICRAQDTLFRVHMSQLARRSVYFRDMFSVPRGQSTDAAQLRYGGLREFGVDVDVTSIIHLYDSAEDAGNLLTALYDGPYVVMLRAAPCSDNAVKRFWRQRER